MSSRVGHIRPLILKWEGGLSRDPADTASSNPAPWPNPLNGQTGYHTNKGVTYTTFASMAPKLGYAISPENFFTMPDKVWDSIFKLGYWDPWGLDQMNSQAIADTIACFAWGSGVSGSFRSVKNFLASKGKMVATPAQAVAVINELSSGANEENLFLELIDLRERFFRSLNQPKFLQGWLNRLADIKQFGLSTIKKKGS